VLDAVGFWVRKKVAVAASGSATTALFTITRRAVSLASVCISRRSGSKPTYVARPSNGWNGGNGSSEAPMSTSVSEMPVSARASSAVRSPLVNSPM
jgi:hypothetical protein